MKLVNKKPPCATAHRESSLQGKHLGLLALLLFHSCTQLMPTEPLSFLSTFWALQAPLQRASHRECWAKRWLNPQCFTRSYLLRGMWPQSLREHSQWWKHQELSDDSSVWLSHLSLHTPLSGQTGPVFLLALHFSLPFFVLLSQVRKMFSPQLWVIATLPKHILVLSCSFPGAAKHIPVLTPAP